MGIEPTLLRTRALSVRLNRSAKTASTEHILPPTLTERLHGAMATRRIPDPKIGGSIPSEVIQFFLTPRVLGWGCLSKTNAPCALLSTLYFLGGGFELE